MLQIQYLRGGVMRKKKGFVLASTLIMMVFVLSISSVMVIILANHNRHLNSLKTFHQNKQTALEISTDFVELAYNDFINLYQILNYSVLQSSPETVIENYDENIKITLTSYGETQTLTAIKQPKGVLIAQVEKFHGEVVVWQIYGGDK